MGKKYYAVREGRVRGVFDSWAACERQVKGYSGAIYKAFTSRQAAAEFIAAEISPIKGMSMAEYFETAKAFKRRSSRRKKTEISAQTADETAESMLADVAPHCMVAYIDGSFDKKNNVVGAGGIMFYEGQEETFSFGTDKELYTAYWNVSGELLATMHVIKAAVAKKMKEVHIYYDYMGIEMWATGRWKANNPLTVAYAEFILNNRRQLKMVFHKVAAHTGVVYNEKADALAKAGTLKIIDL